MNGTAKELVSQALSRVFTLQSVCETVIKGIPGTDEGERMASCLTIIIEQLNMTGDLLDKACLAGEGSK